MIKTEQNFREIVNNDLFIEGQEYADYVVDDSIGKQISITFIAKEYGRNEYFGSGFFELQITRQMSYIEPPSIWNFFRIGGQWNSDHPKIRDKKIMGPGIAIIQGITGPEVLEWADYLERLLKLIAFQ